MRERSRLTLWNMEALQGWLHPAKEKIAKEEVLGKKLELHRKRREGKKGPAGQVFQSINSEGGGLESAPSERTEHKTGRYAMHDF